MKMRLGYLLPMVLLAQLASTVGYCEGAASWQNYKKPSRTVLFGKLNKHQFNVTQNGGTELPYKNPYWNNKSPGIYVDFLSGEPLFSTVHQYDSGTGWPTFSDTLMESNLVMKEDHQLFYMKRTEISSKLGGNHLGYVFNDGPGIKGKRYTVNSASLRLIPVDKLKKEGYGEYLPLFHGHKAKK